jgi:hypothetical protein
VHNGNDDKTSGIEQTSGDTAPVPFAPVTPAIGRWRLWTAGVIALAATGLFGWIALRLSDTFAKRWEQVETGFDRALVRELLGEPDVAYPELEVDAPFLRVWHDRFGIGNERWVYDRVPHGQRLRFYYTLLFDDGKVIDKSIRYALTDEEPP